MSKEIFSVVFVVLMAQACYGNYLREYANEDTHVLEHSSPQPQDDLGFMHFGRCRVDEYLNRKGECVRYTDKQLDRLKFLIEAPLRCPPGQAPDHRGKCRPKHD